LIFALLQPAALHAQLPMRGMPRLGGGMGGAGSKGGNDSIKFEKRNFADDSVTVRFRYLDTAKYSGFDSSISDFYRKVPMKTDHITLGNNGNAARNLLYSPVLKPGWDPGFHAFDLYAFRLEDARFMTTTKPYTELGYLVGSKSEQQINVLHTQNIRPNWNFVFEYRLVNSPGYFNSQNANHKNLRFSTQYTSKDERYNLFFVAMSNSLQSSENGGIRNDSFLVNPNTAFNDRFNIPTKLSDSVFSTRNFFNVKLYTGSSYQESQFLLRQQYDFGQKDSVVTDSSVHRYFIPRLRLEHTIRYGSNDFLYLDIQGKRDRAYYLEHYGISGSSDTVDVHDSWRELTNDFSIIQFPFARNPLQFIKVGASLQMLQVRNLANDFSGPAQTIKSRSSNLFLHGEYRNRTRDKRWDMELYGEFWTLGNYAGNYRALATLRTLLSRKLGYLELGFENVNRTPSYIYSGASSFPVIGVADLKKENVTHLSGLLDIPALQLKLSGHYYLTANYTYFRDFNKVYQETGLFNLLRLGVNKTFRVARNWRWYSDLYLQLTAGNAPIHLPLMYTRNRFAFEGKLFTNLVLSTGVDTRYYTPYKGDDYSPVTGQFFYQNNETLIIRPDIAAYVNFRIRSFTSYVRLENLNSLTFKYGFGFKDVNHGAPLYPYPGMVFRLGVFWGFVN
jgi:hypothetical protein